MAEMNEEMDAGVLAAWAGMKAAECEREVAMADSVGMSQLGAAAQLNAKYFRAIERRLSPSKRA